MVQKTKRARKPRSSRRRIKRQIAKPDDEQNAEEHHFYSKMVFDGNTMFTESQKDDEPIKRQKITLRQLEEDIPIGAELIKTHLDRKVPNALNRPIPRDIGFKSVLPNPYDLGLMPPRSSTRTRRRHKHHHSRDHRRRDNENLRLIIQDEDDNNNQQRNLFDLP
jgi:hypothetical protein